MIMTNDRQPETNNDSYHSNHALTQNVDAPNVLHPTEHPRHTRACAERPSAAPVPITKTTSRVCKRAKRRSAVGDCSVQKRCWLRTPPCLQNPKIPENLAPKTLYKAAIKWSKGWDDTAPGSMVAASWSQPANLKTSPGTVAHEVAACCGTF